MNLKKLFHASFRVYAEDTDMMGIVYHANYLHFFERARSDLLREIGLPLTALAKYDYHFAINAIKLDYNYPARLDDLLAIKTQIIKQKACSLLFEQKMLNQQDKLLAKLEVNLVCVNQQMKPKRLPKEFLSITID